MTKALAGVNPVYPNPKERGFSLSLDLKMPSSPVRRLGLSGLYGVNPRIIAK